MDSFPFVDGASEATFAFNSGYRRADRRVGCRRGLRGAPTVHPAAGGACHRANGIPTT